MQTIVLISVLVLSQVPGGGTSQAAGDRLKAVLERAAKEPDFDEAGLILSSACSDESFLRYAYLTPTNLDERSLYILVWGRWGRHVESSRISGRRQQRILVESISAKPELIRSDLRTDRYETYIRKRSRFSGGPHPRSFTYFESGQRADDIAEFHIERLRKEATHPAKAIMDPHNVLVGFTAEEVEWMILYDWQEVCGLCDRLDLIEKATPENWRGRFPELDRWFKENRPFLKWDDGKSCVRIDAEAKADGDSTPREDRSIPELKPPWQLPR